MKYKCTHNEDRKQNEAREEIPQPTDPGDSGIFLVVERKRVKNELKKIKRKTQLTLSN